MIVERRSIPVSVVVPTKNEELAITDCLKSLEAFSQVVVVDSGSEDRTQEIARALGVAVFDYQWNGRYPKKKQWSLDNLPLKNEWVLFIDADEKPDPQLIREIAHLASSGKIDNFAAADIELDYHFLGKQLRYGHRVVKRALVHRARTHFPPLQDLDAPGMGEQEGHYQPVAEGPIYRCEGRIEHLDPDPFNTWIARHNRYSDWEAYLESHPELISEVNRLRSGRSRRYREVPLKPVVFFLYSYIARLGFLDGRAGLHYALAHAFYFWQIGIKRQELIHTGV